MNQQNKQTLKKDKQVSFDTKLYEIPVLTGIEPYEPYSEIVEFDKKIDDLFHSENIKSQK